MDVSAEWLKMVRNAGIALWQLNIAENTWEWSDSIYPLLGLPSGSHLTDLRSFLGHVYPDDRSAFESAIERTVAGNVPCDVRVRARSPEGTVRWLSVHGRVEQDASGRGIRLLGTMSDVTDFFISPGEIAAAVRDLRKRLQDPDPQSFAMRFGRSVSTLYSWETEGRPNPESLRELMHLAEQIGADDLLYKFRRGLVCEYTETAPLREEGPGFIWHIGNKDREYMSRAQVIATDPQFSYLQEEFERLTAPVAQMLDASYVPHRPTIEEIAQRVLRLMRRATARESSEA